MAGTHGHFICFLYILCMIFVHIFFKSRKMSTALKKELITIAHCAMQRLENTGQNHTTTSDLWTS